MGRKNARQGHSCGGHKRGVCSGCLSPESTRIATGTGFGGEKASIWSITSGERLVGPLKQDNSVTGIRFSPDGEHIANLTQIFNSHTGDNLKRCRT